MHVAEAFLPLKVCLGAAPHTLTAAAVAQTVRACAAALDVKPYQARREAADTLRVLAVSVSASGPADEAQRALAAQRDAIVSALQVTSVDYLLLSLPCAVSCRMQALQGSLPTPAVQAVNCCLCAWCGLPPSTGKDSSSEFVRSVCRACAHRSRLLVLCVAEEPVRQDPARARCRGACPGAARRRAQCAGSRSS